MKRMKRLTALVLTLCMLFSLAPIASAANGTIKMTLNSNTMTVNGVSKKIDENTAIKPQVKTVNGKGYTMLPLRAVVEAMGGQVYYDIATKVITMTYNGTTVKHTIGTKTATVNGATKTMDIASYAANERTYVHLRAIELLSSSIAVKWVATAPNDVTITYPQTTTSNGTKTVNLTIKNATATSYLAFDSLKLAPAGTTNFSGNLLSDTLYNGGSRTLTMAIQPGKYDLQGVDINKNTFNWYNLDFTGVQNNAVLSLTTGTQYSLSLDGSLSGNQTAQVTVINSTGKLITKIQAYHSTGTLANAVTVSNATVAVNGYASFTIPYDANAPYYFLVVTLNDGSTRTYQYVNLGTPFVTVYLLADGRFTYTTATSDTGVFFVNRTGGKISTLQMKLGEDGDWSDNLLKKDLKSGDYIEINAYSTSELRNMEVFFRVKASGNGKSVKVVKTLKDSIVFYYGSALDVKYNMDPNEVVYEEGLWLFNDTNIDFDYFYVINANDIYYDYDSEDEEEVIDSWDADDFFNKTRIDGTKYDWEEYAEELKNFDDRDEELIDGWDVDDLAKSTLVFMGEYTEGETEKVAYGFASISRSSSKFDYNAYVELTIDTNHAIEGDVSYDYTEDDWSDTDEGLIIYNDSGAKAKIYVSDVKLDADNYDDKADDVITLNDEEYEASEEFDDYDDIRDTTIYFYVDFTGSTSNDYAGSFDTEDRARDNVCLIIGSKLSKCDQEYNWVYEEEDEDEGVYLYNSSDYKITEVKVGTSKTKSEAEVVYDGSIKSEKTKVIELELDDISEETLYFWVEYVDEEDDTDTLKAYEVEIGEYEEDYEDNVMFRFTGTKVRVSYDVDLEDYNI